MNRDFSKNYLMILETLERKINIQETILLKYLKIELDTDLKIILLDYQNN